MTVSKIVSVIMIMTAVRIVMMIPTKNEKNGYLSISTAAACEVGLLKGEGVLNCAVPVFFFLAICVYIVCNCCIHVLYIFWSLVSLFSHLYDV